MTVRRPRLADVADRAGVSVATVSKVVNARTDVSPETRARVLAVLEESGYRSPVVRNAGERPVVVALLDGIGTMYAATVLHGMVLGATANGVELVVRFAPTTPDRAASAAPATATLPHGCVGIVAVTHGMRAVRTFDPHDRVPVVIIDPSETPPEEWLTLGATNWTGARVATEHLIALGHSRIAWVGGPTASLASDERLHGYRAALQFAGLEQPRGFEANDDFSVQAGHDIAARLLGSDDRPTAIVAANDEIAIGVIEAARELGLRVPEDISVTGFDDTPQATWTTPQLTSVRQPLADMGRMAIRMLLDNGATVGPDSHHLELTTKLMIRGSTAAPAAR